MKILVACEYSGVVREAFRKLGHDAISCDLLPTEQSGPHIQGDVTELLKQKWDMLIAFPPCTHLAVSGSKYFKQKVEDGRQQKAIEFFMMFARANCPRIAIENPVGIMSSVWRKPDQIIQPYEYGHLETKKTCLWLNCLPLLKPTNILKKPRNGWNNQNISRNGKYSGFRNYDENGKILAWNDPRTAHLRSKTYQGIADAMAEQWSDPEYEQLRMSI